jgi:hypothetical protein
MRKTIFGTVVVFFVLVALYACHKDPPPLPKVVRSTDGCLPVNLQLGVLAYYPFGGGSLKDASGNGHDLVRYNYSNSTMDRDGNPDCAYEFMASSGGCFKMTNPVFLDNLPKQQFSISLWYKPTGQQQYSNPEILVSRGEGLNNPGTYGSWSVALFDCRRVAWGMNQDVVQDPASLNNCSWYLSSICDSWHHLVVTYDGSVKRMYRDGMLVASSANAPGAAVSPNAGDLILGKMFTGILDDVVIYNRVLDIGEVRQLMGLAGCCDRG